MYLFPNNTFEVSTDFLAYSKNLFLPVMFHKLIKNNEIPAFPLYKSFVKTEGNQTSSSKPCIVTLIQAKSFRPYSLTPSIELSIIKSPILVAVDNHNSGFNLL
ncbi:Uncharacterised protein [Streptococcus pneumoniae]|nr:Uncharacterised protein [Streptococcus pneumoniae]